jgi:hypothetical protein
MKPKEKAKELVSKFSSKLPWYSEKDNLRKAKECALIYVKGMRDMAESIWEKLIDEHTVKYWDEIKQEIIKL